MAATAQASTKTKPKQNTCRYNFYRNTFVTDTVPENLGDEYWTYQNQWKTRWISAGGEKMGSLPGVPHPIQIPKEVKTWINEHHNHYEKFSENGRTRYRVSVFTAELWEYDPDGLPVAIRWTMVALDRSFRTICENP